MSVNDCASALSIDFEATNKFQRVGKFMGTESMNGESRRYVYYVLDSVSITVCVLLYLILIEFYEIGTISVIMCKLRLGKFPKSHDL